MHGTGAPLGRFSSEVPAEALEAARAVADVLSRARSVLVLGHAGADGDVCGSSLGLALALRELGKDVVVYNEDPYPDASDPRAFAARQKAESATVVSTPIASSWGTALPAHALRGLGKTVTDSVID